LSNNETQSGSKELTEGQRKYKEWKENKKSRLRRPLTARDKTAIKLKIGLRPADPFPMCPHKNKGFVLGREAIGDFSHSDRHPRKVEGQPRAFKKKEEWHYACKECACPFVAGMGTYHYGYGWCHCHERRKSRTACDNFAEKHLQALRNRHPSKYKEADDLITDVVKAGDDAKSRYDLMVDLVGVQDYLRVFRSRLSVYDKTKRDDKPIVKAVKDLTAAIEENGSFDSNQIAAIKMSLEAIETRLVCPLTEKGQFGPVPMSDATQIKLTAATLSQFTKAAKDVFVIVKEQWITYEAFEIWQGQFMKYLLDEFGEQTYETADLGAIRIAEGIANALDKTGIPRQGGH